MSAPYAHTTVMLDEALRYLAPVSGGLYCDATLGGGGHAEAILETSSPGGRLIGVDRDGDALEATRARLARFGDRVRLIHGRLGQLPAILEAEGGGPLDGLIVDLGISSPQVDRAERGFSFQKTGPLDMRMDQSQGETAGQLLRRISVEEVADILRRFGEERFARPIARNIKEAVARGELATTTDLARTVAAALPARERIHRATDPATRTFQALRIAVNEELDDLRHFLAGFLSLLRPGGTLVTIAFHSLEDRLVKERLRELSRHPGVPADVAAALGIRPDPEIELLTRHAVKPSDDEIARNPRARSARLRAGRRR